MGTSPLELDFPMTWRVILRWPLNSGVRIWLVKHDQQARRKQVVGKLGGR